ncbi:hypothetical protein EI94DRAFT_93507 [Lactarius quietus]|nr:hypothetical protein EI94DRAFT_93507 [Lactarius quietus]
MFPTSLSFNPTHTAHNLGTTHVLTSRFNIKCLTNTRCFYPSSFLSQGCLGIYHSTGSTMVYTKGLVVYTANTRFLPKCIGLVPRVCLPCVSFHCCLSLTNPNGHHDTMSKPSTRMWSQRMTDCGQSRWSPCHTPFLLCLGTVIFFALGDYFRETQNQGPPASGANV